MNLKLIPPDRSRCQAMILPGSFMTLGPRVWERCKARPTKIVTESTPGKDGQIGSMSLCDECFLMFVKQGKTPGFTVEKV